jgi:hypothetical protein
MIYVLYLTCLSPIFTTALVLNRSKRNFPQKNWFALTAILLSYLMVLVCVILILIPAQLVTVIFLPTDLALKLPPPLTYWFPIASFVALHELWITAGLALLSSYWIYKYLTSNWVQSFELVESHE